MEIFDYKEFKKEFDSGELCGLEYLGNTIIKDLKAKKEKEREKDWLGYTRTDYILDLYNATMILNDCVFIYESTNVKNNFKWDLYSEIRDKLFEELDILECIEV